MTGFLKHSYKLLIFFVYFFLALFILPSDVFSCDNSVQNTQYSVSSTKNETSIINNNKEDYHFIFQSRNRSEEITSQSNRNNNLGFCSFDKANINYDLSNGSVWEETAYPIYVSNNITRNLKNVIYTRAP